MRFLGILFLLIAGGIAAWDLWTAGGFAAWHASALGELWYQVSPSSLNMLQAGTQRYLHPDVWDRVLLPIVLQPAWMVFAVPGIVLWGLSLLRRLVRRS